MTNRQKQTKTLEFLGHPSTGFDPKIEAAIQDVCMWLLHCRSEPCHHSWKMLVLKSHKTFATKKENSINLLIFGILFAHLSLPWSIGSVALSFLVRLFVCRRPAMVTPD